MINSLQRIVPLKEGFIQQSADKMAFYAFICNKIEGLAPLQCIIKTLNWESLLFLVY